jgi:hypothetical protein
MIYLFIIAFSYCLSVVLDKWFGPTMIFHFYYKWLLKIGKVEFDEEGNITNENTYRKFIKPLGFCLVCTNVWITIICFALLSLFYPIEYIYLLPCIIFANWLVIKF